MKLLAARDRDGIRAPLNLGAKAAQCKFAMVAGAHRLAYRGCALGLQSGKKQGSLNLGAGHRRPVGDPLQLRASISTGAWPSCRWINAPISSSGLHTRSMGLRFSERPLQRELARLPRQQS